MNPQDYLKRCDLVKAGGVWVLSVEGRLRKEVASFEKAWREFLKQQTVLKGVEEERRRADDTLKEAKETYKALVTQAPPLLRRSDVAVLALAENKCKMAGEAAKESRKAADDARGAVNNMSEKLAAQVKDLREKHDRAREQYTVLQDAAAIHRTIEDYNSEEEKRTILGPSDFFRKFGPKLENLEKEVGAISERVPIRQHNGLWYVEVNLNGKKKLEMAVNTGSTVVHLPWKAAVEAGLDLSRGKPVVAILADGSRSQDLLVTVPTVQVGRFTARDVECAVSRKDTADVAPLLGQSFLGQYGCRIDEAERVLVLPGGPDSGKRKMRK